MAMKLNAGEVGRPEYYLIWPKEIIVGQNKPRYEQHSEEVIRARKESYEVPDASGKPIGQVTPVVCRRVAENKVQLVAGFCRHAAMLLYNEEHPESPMRLKCIVSDMNDEEALVKATIENHERQANTPMDLAFSHRAFRELGWSDAKIAAHYKLSQGRVSQLTKLLRLPSEIQRKVHRGETSVEAAILLADMPEEDRDRILAATSEEKPAEEPVTETKPEEKPAKKKPGRKSTTAKIKQHVRDAKIANGNGSTPARTLSEVRDFWESNTGKAEDKWLQDLAELNLEFIRGKITNSTMLSRLTDLFYRSEEPVVNPTMKQQTFSELATQMEEKALEAFLPPEEPEEVLVIAPADDLADFIPPEE